MSRWPGRLITRNPVTPGGPSPTARAPGVWTLPEVAYWTRQGLWPNASADPYWSYVSYLLGTTSTNAQQNNTFLDGSTNNFTITRFGNTTQGSFAPYGPDWSNYFDGSGDYLSTPNNAAFQFGTGDFTIECWVNKTVAANGSIVDVRSGGTGAVPWAFYIDASNFPYFYDGTVYTSSVATTLNAWNHVAIVRTSGVLKIFVNGVQGYSAAYTASLNAAGSLLVGGTAAYTTGYISNLRIVKGTAVYTANFTPPTAPLTAISGTSLLTCQSNRFRDASTNNFAITKFGETSVTAFSPFNLPAPGYAPATYGGSGYFDGTSDGLTAPNNAAFNLSNGDFTLECWVYNTEVANSIGYAGVWGSSYILYREATTYRFYYTTAAGSPLTSSIPAITNAWTHLAVVRNGATLTFYVNGVSGGSTNVGTTAFSTASSVFGIGANFETGSPGFPFTGYMAGLRLVKGTAIYTAAFTPPTTPPTEVTGTSILCNFTNAGIFDASMQNNMETAGNAQVSTTQAKYGTTSAYFDGNGDWLVSPNRPEHNFGTGDFTIEAWVYPATTNSQATIVSNYNGPSSGWGLLLGSTGPLFGWGDTNLLAGSSAFNQNAWNHIAITRSGTSLRMFLNGTQVASATNSTDFTSTGALFVGRLREATAGFFWQGYIDDLRLTKGYARYTANFTPPAAALPAF